MLLNTRYRVEGLNGRNIEFLERLIITTPKHPSIHVWTYCIRTSSNPLNVSSRGLHSIVGYLKKQSSQPAHPGMISAEIDAARQAKSNHIFINILLLINI